MFADECSQMEVEKQILRGAQDDKAFREGTTDAGPAAFSSCVLGEGFRPRVSTAHQNLQRSMLRRSFERKPRKNLTAEDHCR